MVIAIPISIMVTSGAFFDCEWDADANNSHTLLTYSIIMKGHTDLSLPVILNLVFRSKICGSEVVKERGRSSNAREQTTRSAGAQFY